MYNLTDRHVVLGVSGSIAAYKTADLASKLMQGGALVDVVMTEAATRFVTSLTFFGVTGRPVYVDMFDETSGAAELHVELGRRADVLVVAPATATTISRLALGMAEDLVGLTVLASRAPLIVCPAMDSQMFENAATQYNLETLKNRGALIVGPEIGRLASGQVGPGRLAELDSIIGAIRYALGLSRGDLGGRKVVVSAGGTQEPIDPVRYVGNYSSGKMGYAVAEAARDRGAEVVLVSAPTSLTAPYGVTLISVQQAEEMRQAVIEASRRADILVMAAAVADYRPLATTERKIKRTTGTLTLELVATPDILSQLGGNNRLVKVGFAAETHDLMAAARSKLKEKGLHLIAANDVVADTVFGSDTNRVVLLDKEGRQEELPLLTKYEVARRILDRAMSWLDG